jgi:hypothetical protein
VECPLRVGGFRGQVQHKLYYLLSETDIIACVPGILEGVRN